MTDNFGVFYSCENITRLVQYLLLFCSRTTTSLLIASHPVYESQIQSHLEEGEVKPRKNTFFRLLWFQHCHWWLAWRLKRWLWAVTGHVGRYKSMMPELSIYLFSGEWQRGVRFCLDSSSPLSANVSTRNEVDSGIVSGTSSHLIIIFLLFSSTVPLLSRPDNIAQSLEAFHGYVSVGRRLVQHNYALSCSGQKFLLMWRCRFKVIYFI